MDTEDLRPGTRRRRQPDASGYAKGERVRQRLLQAGLAVFGEVGFRAATTRRIAEAAGVQLPTIAYYFENKEGLYLACAQEIVQGYRRHMGRSAVRAMAALQAGGDAAAARAALHELMAALVDLLVGRDETRHWAGFIARESSDKGPAYEALYADVWVPGGELTARLVACLRGEAAVSPAARVQALLLIASATVLQSGEGVARRLLDWPSVGTAERQTLLAALRTQIEAIGRC